METQKKNKGIWWLVFLASGFWHGAAWTFIFWGIYHGLFLVLERAFLGKILQKIGKFPATIFTFLIVAIGWVFFRADTAAKAIAIIGKLFSVDYHLPVGYFNNQFLFYFLLAIIFSFFASFKRGQILQPKIFEPKALAISVVALLIIEVAIQFRARKVDQDGPVAAVQFLESLFVSSFQLD